MKSNFAIPMYHIGLDPFIGGSYICFKINHCIYKRLDGNRIGSSVLGFGGSPMLLIFVFRTT